MYRNGWEVCIEQHIHEILGDKRQINQKVDIIKMDVSRERGFYIGKNILQVVK